VAGILITGMGDGRCQECLSLWECWTHNTHISLWKLMDNVHRASLDPQLQIWKVCHYGSLFGFVGPCLSIKKKQQHGHLAIHDIHCPHRFVCSYLIVLDSVPTTLPRAGIQHALVRDYTFIHSPKRDDLVKVTHRPLIYPVVLPHPCSSVVFVRPHDWNYAPHEIDNFYRHKNKPSQAKGYAVAADKGT